MSTVTETGRQIPRIRAWLVALLAALLVVPVVAGAVAAGAAVTPAVSATVNQFGFPHWYGDSTGFGSN